MKAWLAIIIAIVGACGTAVAQVRAKADVTCKPAAGTLHYDCIVTLADRRTNAPLANVTVMVGADMPSMAGLHNVAPVKAKPGPTPGRYEVRLALEMHGDWMLHIDVAGPLRDRILSPLRFEPEQVTPGAPKPPAKGRKH